MKAHCGQGLRKIVAVALLTGVAPWLAPAQENTGQGNLPAAQNSTIEAKPDKQEKNLNKAVDKLLKNYPPKIKN